MTVLIFLALWIAAACICGHLAGKKGRSVGIWVVLGFLFSWIAVLIIACLRTDVAALRIKAAKDAVISDIDRTKMML